MLGVSEAQPEGPSNLRPDGTPKLIRSLRHRAHRPITDDDVRAIRQAYAEGGSYRSLAEQYEMSQGAIGRIVRGDTFRDVV